MYGMRLLNHEGQNVAMTPKAHNKDVLDVKSVDAEDVKLIPFGGMTVADESPATSKAVLSLEKIKNSELPELSTLPYRKLIWQLALRSAVWHQLDSKKGNSEKEFNAMWRCVNEFGKRFIKDFKVLD